MMTRYIGCAVAIVTTTILASNANAALILTLSDDGSGGTLATFGGSGTAIETGAGASFGNLGNYTTLDLNVLSFVTPIHVVGGVSITSITIDDDSAQLTPDDDLSLFLSGPIAAGSAYAVSGSSLIDGLSFSALIPGVFVSQFAIGPFDQLTLTVMAKAVPVPEPSTLALLAVALGSMVIGRVRRSGRNMLSSSFG